MSYTASYFHIVFGTYRRQQVLSMDIKENMKNYISGILRNHNSKLIAANYMPNHVHVLINLGADVALAKVVGIIKQSLSVWLKKDAKCMMFFRWSKEYYGVSVSPSNVPNVEKYIMNQENHHYAKSFDEELDVMISKAGMQRYPDSFFE